MKITPIDITGHTFAVKFRGFDQEEVRSFLNLVSSEFEKLISEHNALKETLAQLQTSVSDLKERERILKETLLTAQRLADEIREEARKEGQLIVKEADVKAGQLLDQAARKAGELEGVITALRVERDAFAQRIRSAVEQHLRLLDMHRNEDEVEDRLRFMKKPGEGSGAAGSQG
jgi:cell division initiation protein